MTGPFKLKKGKDLEDFFKSATKTPNPTTKAVNYDPKKGLAEHLDARTPNTPTDVQMENKGDFNIPNLHKDTKMSLSKKKKKN